MQTQRKFRTLSDFENGAKVKSQLLAILTDLYLQVWSESFIPLRRCGADKGLQTAGWVI